MRLLDLDLRASLFELLLEVLGILLGHALLQSLGGALDGSLGLGQALAGDLTDSLDDLDLGGGVEAGQDHVELGLLLSGSSSSAASGGSGHSGGGHAELQLADTSDILSCGIDIRVSPPGKAVKTITLRSGGEKAFVAIALYFAILKLRPTPFCVLDEIEAALDDVNVQRFAKYIRRLTDSTQFIVITHRRGTMEEADMLYGVTMQEQGVSKMLMLNLAEAEKRLKNTIK